MTDHNYLTVHSLTALPFHNLNRDERGLPNQTRQGGTIRGLLSSQSIKHAARARYELAAARFGDRPSARSRDLAKEAVARAVIVAEAQGVVLDAGTALERAVAVLSSFTTKPKKPKAKKPGKPKAAKEDEDGPAKSEDKDTVLWLSSDEIDALAGLLLSEAAIEQDAILEPGRTLSLPIAGFGRMTAYAPESGTEAAIAVGPAITTHPITIDVDYFSAVDDLAGAGAAHLGQSLFTSGVYYHTLTVDKRQMRRSWSGWDLPDADPRLLEFVKALILALPQGKKNSTAADILPALIIAEQQQYRTTASFEAAVAAGPGGGYLESSAAALVDQLERSRAFDPDEFGETLVSGLNPELGGGLGQSANLSELTHGILAWLRA